MSSPVANWKTPGSVKDVQRFLGLCNYYRQFVPKFSEIASPLSTRFQWSVECDDSFKLLKNVLCKAPVLAYPLSKGQYILDTDASNVGIGGILSQVQNNKEK